MPVPRLVTDVVIGGLWSASAVTVAGYTWSSVQSTWQKMPTPGGPDSTGLNQTGAGQKNDPAKVPAAPPSGGVHGTKPAPTFPDKNGKPLPLPANTVLLSGQAQTISWLEAHGWSKPQIRKYFKALYLNLPPGF